MLAYPQLTALSVTQFPIQKKKTLRTVVNSLADGRSIKLPDSPAEMTEWQLQYASLSDEEASALEAFFESTEGNVGAFTFLDPTANLIAWSDHLDHAEWSKAPLLAISGGLPDPGGGANAWRLSNPAGAPQSLTQILNAPGGYTYCLSAYARSSVVPTVCSFLRDSARSDRTLGSDWRRFAFTGSGNILAETVEFGIEVPPGGFLDVYGLQVEPQAGASIYKPSTWGGIYPSAQFRDDFLAITATDVNRHTATVNIIHAVRL